MMIRVFLRLLAASISALSSVYLSASKEPRHGYSDGTEIRQTFYRKKARIVLRWFPLEDSTKYFTVIWQSELTKSLVDEESGHGYDGYYVSDFCDTKVTYRKGKAYPFIIYIPSLYVGHWNTVRLLERNELSETPAATAIYLRSMEKAYNPWHFSGSEPSKKGYMTTTIEHGVVKREQRTLTFSGLHDSYESAAQRALPLGSISFRVKDYEKKAVYDLGDDRPSLIVKNGLDYELLRGDDYGYGEEKPFTIPLKHKKNPDGSLSWAPKNDLYVNRYTGEMSSERTSSDFVKTDQIYLPIPKQYPTSYPFRVIYSTLTGFGAAVIDFTVVVEKSSLGYCVNSDWCVEEI
jgi:hypothetical protein